MRIWKTTRAQWRSINSNWAKRSKRTRCCNHRWPQSNFKYKNWRRSNRATYSAGPGALQNIELISGLGVEKLKIWATQITSVLNQERVINFKDMKRSLEYVVDKAILKSQFKISNWENVLLDKSICLTRMGLQKLLQHQEFSVPQVNWIKSYTHPKAI